MGFECGCCGELRFLGEKLTASGSKLTMYKFSNCCSMGQITAGRDSNGQVLPTFREPPPLLQELLIFNSAECRHFRKHIRHYNSALAMASVGPNFVTRGPGSSKINPKVALRGRMYHEMGPLIPPIGKKPRFSAVHIHDTEDASHNRKNFYGILREHLLSRLTNMLHGNNKLDQTFLSLRDLVNMNRIPEDVPLVINAHELTKPGHERKYNVPEASEVAALIIGEQYGVLYIALRRRGRLDANGSEKLASFE